VAPKEIISFYFKETNINRKQHKNDNKRQHKPTNGNKHQHTAEARAFSN